MERGRAIFWAMVFIVLGIIGFCLYGLPAIENASVKEAKAAVLTIPYTLIGQDGEVINTRLRIRMLETDKIVDMELKGRFPFSVEEMGEGNTYEIAYKGLWETKEIVSIVLIQSREALVREIAESDEMPDISNWYFDHSNLHPELFEIKYGIRFEIGGNNILYDVYYDITEEEPVLEVMELKFINKDFEITARKIWIKRELFWLEKDDKRKIYISRENGKPKLELK